ncbi:MAG: cytochrome P450, partial [Acidobacteriia bacterium]|nr:cytochrome P450 [Terriglobia bacterium]
MKAARTVGHPMKRKYPDGPKINLPLALLAQMLPRLFRLDPLTFSDGLRKFGDIAHYKFGPLHVYQLNDPSLIRQVLVEEAEKFHKATLVKRAFRPISREGLLTSDGALWKQQRKLMQPAFHHRQLAGYAGLMADAAQTMMDSFADGELRDIGASMTKLTLGIVVKSLFGTNLPSEASEITRSLVPALDATNRRLNSVVRVPSWVPTPRHLRERRAIAKLDAMLQLLIKARRAST